MLGRGRRTMPGHHAPRPPQVPSTGFWKHLSGRAGVSAQSENVDDAAYRIGLPQRRWNGSGPGQQQRSASSLVSCLLLILGLIATACDRTVGPQAVYEDARMKLKRGELRPALEETNKTLQRFPSEKEEWHWRFRVLDRKSTRL